MNFRKNRDYSLPLGVYIIFVLIFLIALGPYFKLQQVATLGLLPSLAFIAFLIDLKTINTNKKEFLLFLLLFILGLTTVFYYIDYEEFIRNISLMFGAVISAYIVIGINSKRNYDDFFHIGYILTIIILFGIMYLQGNIDLANFASRVDYRDRFLLNANFYSYLSVFANFSLFYLYLKYRSKFLLLLLILMPLLFLVIAFTTQSRQGLGIIILMNLCFWVFVFKNQSKNKLTKPFRYIIFLIFVVVIGIKFYDIYENSTVKNRVSRISNTEDARELLFYEGLEIFSEHPLIGIGMGQFPQYSGWGKFSHNSYSEILSEQGIIGAILLLVLYGMPTIQSIRNFRKYPNDELVRCNLLFFAIFLIYNNAYVFYKFPFSMLYFFLIISIQHKVNMNQNVNYLKTRTL